MQITNTLSTSRSMNIKYLVIVAVMPAMLVGETALTTTDNLERYDRCRYARPDYG
jgi:hypothetical protein